MVWVVEDVIAHSEWDADEIVVVSCVSGVASLVLVHIVSLQESDARSHSQLIYDIVFRSDACGETRAYHVAGVSQPRHIGVEHTATHADFCLHLPLIGRRLALRAVLPCRVLCLYA